MFMGQDGFIWWIGVVEDNNDPLLIGRARVRIFGYHPAYKPTEDSYNDQENNVVSSSELPWAVPVMPVNMSNTYSKIGLGQWVCGFFLDGKEAQEPAILGMMPSANYQNQGFGKYATNRNFNTLDGYIPDGAYSGADFFAKSDRFEWRSPTNHAIIITEQGYKDFLLYHNAGMYIRMAKDASGQNAIVVYHPSGSSVQFRNDGSLYLGGTKCSIDLTASDITISGPGGSYNLIDQLNWISLSPHSDSDGDSFTIGRRPPPPPPPRPGGGGRGCFIASSLITMADGSKKRIDEIQLGDKVLGLDKTTTNIVRFIERVDGSLHKKLYSPVMSMQPFATLDHPLYMYDEWKSADPKLTEKQYPWLGKMNKLYLPILSDNTEKIVYNLWTNNDSTYIVNDYITTSIMGDGGLLVNIMEKGLVSEDRIQELFKEYTSRDNKLTHGAFIFNYTLGKFNISFINRLVAYIANNTQYNDSLRKYVVNLPMRVLSHITHITSFIHKWGSR